MAKAIRKQIQITSHVIVLTLSKAEAQHLLDLTGGQPFSTDTANQRIYDALEGARKP